ncbi:MAG: bacteriophage holin [Myxococcota bacterium]
MSLNPRAFAVTCGLVWGAGVFLLTWWIIAFDGATADVTWLGRIYRGYHLTPAGSVVGLAWAVVDGLLFGTIFAWLYNRLAGVSNAGRGG